MVRIWVNLRSIAARRIALTSAVWCHLMAMKVTRSGSFGENALEARCDIFGASAQMDACNLYLQKWMPGTGTSAINMLAPIQPFLLRS